MLSSSDLSINFQVPFFFNASTSKGHCFVPLWRTSAKDSSGLGAGVGTNIGESSVDSGEFGKSNSVFWWLSIWVSRIDSNLVAFSIGEPNSLFGAADSSRFGAFGKLDSMFWWASIWVWHIGLDLVSTKFGGPNSLSRVLDTLSWKFTPPTTRWWKNLQEKSKN